MIYDVRSLVYDIWYNDRPPLPSMKCGNWLIFTYQNVNRYYIKLFEKELILRKGMVDPLKKNCNIIGFGIARAIAFRVTVSFFNSQIARVWKKWSKIFNKDRMIYSSFSCLNYPYPYFVVGIGLRGIVERGQVQLRIEIAIALRKIAVARKTTPDSKRLIPKPK